ncbi:hypothetical protein AA23498_0954 [Acetobacter nitrogenifigens DSM 23921 = NBRC 105050]|uniref:Copper resistance protein D domain-containing protein n=2 Tax=Acetobacter TaxID=434 RepID=A0A511XBE7_9PROT|nr:MULTISPECIES: membrane protein [Acetobacter]MBO1358625.1 hypothetical protein [Acetobacter sacchari]GBQ90721.1 hypothetical protein AA23498_0954 [Acetobacter nitrogenifigens DSM 23921 = NBRC 105050]GEN60274.1 hypothetical protein ANI02nite_21580 [Acetobacter nitrogenifigens DSM 23921 = NBRC 105050]
MPHILWSLILTLHIAGMTVWVGGATYAALILRPSLTLLDGAQRNAVHLLTLKKFLRVVWHVMPIVLVTGWLMILHEGGFAVVPWTTNAMQLLGLLMAALFLRIVFGPYQTARRALRPQQKTFDSIRTLVLGVAALGLLTILCASMGHGF